MLYISLQWSGSAGRLMCPATQPEGWQQPGGLGLFITLDSKYKHTVGLKWLFSLKIEIKRCICFAYFTLLSLWQLAEHWLSKCVQAVQLKSHAAWKASPCGKGHLCCHAYTHVYTFTTAHTRVVTEGQVNDSVLPKLSHSFCSLLQTKQQRPPGFPLSADPLYLGAARHANTDMGKDVHEAAKCLHCLFSFIYTPETKILLWKHMTNT